MKLSRDELAAIAMHGIYCAMASPQFVDRVRDLRGLLESEANRPLTIRDAVSFWAYKQADSMLVAGKPVK